MLLRPILPYSDIVSPEISRPQLYSVLGGGIISVLAEKVRVCHSKSGESVFVSEGEDSWSMWIIE